MWTNIRAWFQRNEVELTWFLIGLFTEQLFVDLGHSNWQGALCDAVIIVINYTLRPVRS